MRSLARGGNARPDRKEDDMAAIRTHFAEHHSHTVACALAAVFIIGGVAVGQPVLAVLGAFLCGAMMVGMVWMMVSMARHDR
jgi:hypothetical protein